jgi:hypothetical protein
MTTHHWQTFEEGKGRNSLLQTLKNIVSAVGRKTVTGSINRRGEVYE